MESYQEAGALLIAVGEQMMRNDLCAYAAMDGCSDQALIESLMKNGIAQERAEVLIGLDLGVVIDYIHGH